MSNDKMREALELAEKGGFTQDPVVMHDAAKPPAPGECIVEKPNPCDESCPKCGHTDIGRKFIEKGKKVPNEDYGYCNNRYSSGQCHAFYAVRDHIDNRCRCCHYRWQRLPLPKRSPSAPRGAP